MATHLPNGKFWLISYSWLVISSITGPVEKIFRHVEVAPSSIDWAGQWGGQTATLWWFQSKFLPLLMFLLPGPIVSQFIEEVMTSKKQSSRSNLRVGGAHLTALFLVLVEDSSASCLSARGFSTQLKMVVGVVITSSRVIFTNSQMACLNSLTL